VFDYPLAPGESIQISGIVMSNGQKLIARADTAVGAHFLASGVVLT
jgi:hypothetical protein